MEASQAMAQGDMGGGEVTDGAPDQQPQLQPQDGGGAQPQGEHADVNGLIEALAGAHQDQQELLAYLRSAPDQHGSVGAPDPAQLQQQQFQQPQQDLSYLNPDDPAWNPELAAQRLQQMWDQEAERRNQVFEQQRIAPLEARLNEQVQRGEYDRLAAEFPELEHPEVADQVMGVSRQYASLMGDPTVAENPAFVRLVYMAGRGAEAANLEASQQAPQAATLEGAGGAGVAAQAQGVTAEQLLGVGAASGGPLKSRALPFH